MHDDPQFDALLAQGLAASSQDRGGDALRLFRQAAQRMPASGIPHFLMGAEHATHGDVPAAELAFGQAVLLAPDFPLARYQLGLLQFTSQRVPLALLTWEPLLSLAPELPLPHFVRGFAALAQDCHPEALAHFRAGLACPSDNRPLFDDIERVVQAVERLAEAEGNAGNAPPDPPEGHVLLSGYARGLH